jgi:hypothetical protein
MNNGGYGHAAHFSTHEDAPVQFTVWGRAASSSPKYLIDVELSPGGTVETVAADGIVDLMNLLAAWAPVIQAAIACQEAGQRLPPINTDRTLTASCCSWPRNPRSSTSHAFPQVVCSSQPPSTGSAWATVACWPVDHVQVRVVAQHHHPIPANRSPGRLAQRRAEAADDIPPGSVASHDDLVEAAQQPHPPRSGRPA